VLLEVPEAKGEDALVSVVEAEATLEAVGVDIVVASGD
jgi:hypothetical protein